jgi:2-polyprenyl-3-methyl-5-hydroxy-6-metoxy-1,4-benzoquinol methylase
MEEAACDICGGKRGELFLTGRDYLTGDRFSVFRCKDCSLSFVNPRPSPDEMERYYPPAYYGTRRSLFDGVTCFLRARRVEKVHGRREAGSILDVGCGMGRMLRTLQRRGWRVVGTEYGAKPREDATGKEEIEIRYAALEACGLPNNSFDVITLWHVLEHLPNPKETLREIRRVLKRDGNVILAVPNFGSLQAKLTGRCWFHLDVPRHLFHFTPKNLVGLLEQEGFRIEEKRHFSFEYDTFGFVQSLLNLVVRRQNLLFDFLTHRASLGEALKTSGGIKEKRGGLKASSGVAGLPLSLLLAPSLFLLSLIFCPVESLFGYGGTFEVTARKASDKGL